MTYECVKIIFRSIFAVDTLDDVLLDPCMQKFHNLNILHTPFLWTSCYSVCSQALLIPNLSDIDSLSEPPHVSSRHARYVLASARDLFICQFQTPGKDNVVIFTFQSGKVPREEVKWGVTSTFSKTMFYQVILKVDFMPKLNQTTTMRLLCVNVGRTIRPAILLPLVA